MLFVSFVQNYIVIGEIGVSICESWDDVAFKDFIQYKRKALRQRALRVAKRDGSSKGFSRGSPVVASKVETVFSASGSGVSPQDSVSQSSHSSRSRSSRSRARKLEVAKVVADIMHPFMTGFSIHSF